MVPGSSRSSRKPSKPLHPSAVLPKFQQWVCWAGRWRIHASLPEDRPLFSADNLAGTAKGFATQEDVTTPLQVPAI